MIVSVVSCVIGERKTSPEFLFMISRIKSSFQYTLGLFPSPEITSDIQNTVLQNSCLSVFLSRNKKKSEWLSDMQKALNLQIVGLQRYL